MLRLNIFMNWGHSPNFFFLFCFERINFISYFSVNIHYLLNKKWLFRILFFIQEPFTKPSFKLGAPIRPMKALSAGGVRVRFAIGKLDRTNARNLSSKFYQLLLKNKTMKFCVAPQILIKRIICQIFSNYFCKNTNFSAFHFRSAVYFNFYFIFCSNHWRFFLN